MDFGFSVLDQILRKLNFHKLPSRIEVIYYANVYYLIESAEIQQIDSSSNMYDIINDFYIFFISNVSLILEITKTFGAVCALEG